jgi:hypothetical protein
VSLEGQTDGIYIAKVYLDTPSYLKIIKNKDEKVFILCCLLYGNDDCASRLSNVAPTATLFLR